MTESQPGDSPKEPITRLEPDRTPFETFLSASAAEGCSPEVAHQLTSLWHDWQNDKLTPESSLSVMRLKAERMELLGHIERIAHAMGSIASADDANPWYCAELTETQLWFIAQLRKSLMKVETPPYES